MPIYKGSTLIKDLRIGNTQIKKVYKGSTLIYSAGVPVWRFTHSNGTQFLIGEYSTNGYGANTPIDVTDPPNPAITNISGTLGASGSTIKVGDDYTYTYNGVKTFSGVTVYQYTFTPYLSVPLACYVLANSSVGTHVVYGFILDIQNVTSTTIKVGNTTYNRDSTYEKRFTLSGIA